MGLGYINPSGKLLRHLDRLAAWRAGKPFAPIGVEIDLTNRCNLGCKHCHFAYTHSRSRLAKKETRYLDMGDEMDLRLLVRILGEMKEFGVKSVTFTGGGEPTLYPAFGQAIVAARGAGLEVGLYTNGTLITREMAELIKQDCAWVVVSLDAADAVQYLADKQVDAFDQACNGTRELVKAEGNAIVGASFLLSWRHNEFYEPMQMLGRELKVDYVEFRPRVVFDADNPSVADEDTTWARRAIPLLQKFNVWHPGFVDARVEQFRLYANYARNYSRCDGILFTGIITPNGKMWKCVNRRGFPDSCIGDLTTESFADVWAKQKPHTDFAKCRVLCRADVINRKLAELAKPLPHENFV